MNVRYNEREGRWRLAKVVKEHNHCPHACTTLAYTNRLEALTPEMKEFISCLQKSAIPPADILTCFQAKFKKEAPPLTAKDIGNMSTLPKGGVADAHKVLQLLLDLKSKDDEWFMR